MNNKTSIKNFCVNNIFQIIFAAVLCPFFITPSFGQENKCNIEDIPSLKFGSNSQILSIEAKSILHIAANKLEENKSCNLLISGYPTAYKPSQHINDLRLQRIVSYLIEKEGILAERISTNQKIAGGDSNLFILSFTPSLIQSHECNLGDLPQVVFQSNSNSFVASAKSILNSVANKLKDNPFCNIIVVGYPSPSKAGQSLCDKRIEGIKIYLVEKMGISADRITINCEFGGGDPNTVDLKQN